MKWCLLERYVRYVRDADTRSLDRRGVLEVETSIRRELSVALENTQIGG